MMLNCLSGSQFREPTRNAYRFCEAYADHHGASNNPGLITFPFWILAYIVLDLLELPLGTFLIIYHLTQ